MAAIVVTGPAPKRSWNNECSDCCGQPGGCGNCCYVLFCGCCAARDVAKAAGRDSCMSCCVIPVLAGPCVPCWYATDRQHLAEKYNVKDGFGWFTSCLMFALGCGTCLLAQELNHIKSVELAGGLQPTVATTMIIPGQQVMGAAPSYHK